MWFLWSWLGGGLLAIILQARLPPGAKPLARQFKEHTERLLYFIPKTALYMVIYYPRRL